EKKQFFKTPGNGRLRDAIIAVYGNDYNQNLLDISFKGFSYSLSGLISSPGISRLNRKNQFFFVNNRPVKSPMLYKAVDTAYRGLLVSGEYPVVILHLAIPPDQLDVNVHPQKSEVRFGDEKAVFKMLNDVLRSALDQRDVPGGSSWNTIKTENSGGSKYGHGSPVNLGPEWVVVEGALAGDFASNHPQIVKHQTNVSDLGWTRKDLPVWEEEKHHQYKITGQVLNSYIIMENDESLWIVDQHAAHERIMYNRLKKVLSSRNELAQSLAFPLSIDLSVQQMEVVDQNADLFAELGFVIETLSHNSIVLRAVPVYLSGKEQESILEILDLLQEKQKGDLKEATIIKMACTQAVKAGSKLKQLEMETIIEELINAEDYMNCPHGRPTMIKLGHRELDRMFKR
ncbi:MAG: hypothetical protein PHE26_06350, partial [Syntrophomonadaceae bacterium]|nr:hypothetical protein [Syntrophomonadaceae bacterium]